MSKILGKLKATIRWRIALLMDRFSDVCWFDAVMWARFPEHHAFGEVFALRGTAGRCEAAGDFPYCGKCAVLAERKRRGWHGYKVGENCLLKMWDAAAGAGHHLGKRRKPGQDKQALFRLRETAAAERLLRR